MFLKRILNSKNQLQNTFKCLKTSKTDVFNDFSTFNLISTPMKIFSTKNTILNNYQTLLKSNTKKHFSEKLENIQSNILQQQTQNEAESQHNSMPQDLNVKNTTNTTNPPTNDSSSQPDNNQSNSNTKYFKGIFDTYLTDDTYQELHENKFDLFLDKLQSLIKSETQRRERNACFATELRQISLNSKEPLRDLLVHYQGYRNENGFDAEAVAEAISVLGKTNSARTRFHKSYTDLSHWEFINSTRLYHLIDDVKFAVVNSLAYLNGEQFCKIIEGLKLCGYKNTQLALLIEKRLASIVYGNPSAFKAEEEFGRYALLPGVGKKDFLHLNAYATDIAEDKNILGYFEKLMKMKFEDDVNESENNSNQPKSRNISAISKKDNLSGKNLDKVNEAGEKSGELLELEASVQSVIDLMQDAKDLQMNFTDNLNNLVDQYFKFEQLVLENPEIRENPYTKYSLQKIQDKLIEMGFIDIDVYKSVSSRKLSADEFSKIKSDTVIKILHDYIYVNYPDLFAKVLDEIESTQQKANEALKLNFTKYRFSLANLAECLKELSEYAKITDIDVNGEDYQNPEFNLDYYNKEIPERPTEHIRTQPEYTKLYSLTVDFFKSIKKEILRKHKNTHDLKFHTYLIFGYSNLNLTTKDSVDNSIRICAEILSNDRIKHSTADIAELLYALALSGTDMLHTNILHLVLKRLNSQEILELDFNQTLKALWSLLSFESKMEDKFFELLKHLNSFEVYSHITEGVTSYDDISLLFYEFSVALREYSKRLKVDERPEVRETLFLSNKYFANKSVLLKKAELNLADPLKENMEKIFVEKFYKNKLNQNATANLLKEKQNNKGFAQLAAPFIPDLDLDVYGNKFCIFLNSLDKDFKHGNCSGQQKLMKNVLEKFYGCVCVFIPISKLVTFSHGNFAVKFNQNLASSDNLDKLLFNALTQKKPKVSDGVKALQRLNRQFNKFIACLVNANNPEFDLIQSAEPNKEGLEIFFKNLLYATELEAKFAFDSTYAQFGLNLLKFRKVLNALEIVAESLSDNFRKFLNQNLKFDDCAYTSFKEFLITVSTQYGTYYELLQGQRIAHQNPSNSAKALLNDDNWVGKRLNVDLINSDLISEKNSLENLKKKNVAVEILNNNYMWCDEYNPYADWETELHAYLDNFNYFATKSPNKFLFNSHKLGSRKVAQGIFPHPRRFRVMKGNGLKNSALGCEAETANVYESEINRFYHLNEVLIAEEIRKNNSLKAEKLPAQLSMKINLLNINNSLKQNFTDNEIVRFLSEFDFTEKLIEEHLENLNSANSKNNNNNNIEYVSRNADNFKSFNTKLDSLREQFDEFDKYIMKEYHKEKDLVSYDQQASPDQIKKELEDKMRKKLEESEDTDALSIYNPNEIKYKFSVEAILNNIALESENSLLSFSGLGAKAHNEILNNPEKYLEYKRLVSERNLILLKIITKSIQSKQLTENEKKYLENLHKIINASNILNLERNTLSAHGASKLQIKDLSANDLYALNSLANVEIKEDLFNFALSDLVVELNNFIDNKTFNKIIHDIFAEAKAKEFKYDSAKASLFDVNNKEPLLLNKEIKETLWRLSGFFDDLDVQKLKAFLRVKRGKSTFDKIWLQIDEASLEAFIREVNQHENRIEYLEKWIKRKEYEFENRIQLPADNLRLDDSQINKIINKKDKNYRKKLLTNIFQQENLKTISPRDVNKFVNEFVEFLALFDFKYPDTIKDIFRALQDLEEFGNIYNEDLEILRTYKTLFKIEEENPNEFLAVAPVNMEQEKLLNFASEEALLDKDKIFERVKASTIPFVKNVTSILGTHIPK